MTTPTPIKRSHPPTPLGQMLNRYAISLEQLKQCLVAEGVTFNSRSTLHRLVHGKISQEMKQHLYPKVATCLNKFLTLRGLGKAEIDVQLLSIFDEGEYQPMISKRLELSPDLCRHFGFRDAEGRPIDPFASAPSSRDEVYVSGPLQQIIDRLADAIRYQGFVCVTGEIGSGKSTLRALLEDSVMGNDNLMLIWPEFFDMGNVTPMQIAETVLDAFQVYPIPGSSVKRGRAVRELLARQHAEGVRVALAFDECHRLNDAALSSLKNFLEMSSGGFQKYLGIILFGQPVFDARLGDPRFREILERIVSIKMPDFSTVAPGYLAHRLKLAGREMSDLFDQEAVDLISRQATTPLQLGNIANKALQISAEKFHETRVIGAAIKTEMYFENRPETQGFARRNAA